MDLGIGSTLRDARRRSGSSLSDAAESTKVRESYLAALEQEEFAGLGGDVYVKGFISSYARYLSLDPEPLLERYRESLRSDDPVRTPVRQPMRDLPGASDGRQIPAGAAVLLVLVLLVVATVLVVTLTGGGDGGGAAAALELRR